MHGGGRHGQGAEARQPGNTKAEKEEGSRDSAKRPGQGPVGSDRHSPEEGVSGHAGMGQGGDGHIPALGLTGLFRPSATRKDFVGGMIDSGERCRSIFHSMILWKIKNYIFHL